MSITHAILDHTDAPSGSLSEGEMLGTYDATATEFRKATPVRASNTGLSDGDLWVYNSSTGLAEPVASIPTGFDGDYLDAGEIHYPDGSQMLNAAGMLCLRGSGAPGSGVGVDGMGYYDTATGDLWGPKGDSVAGQWTDTQRKGWAFDANVHKAAVDIDLGGNDLLQNGAVVVRTSHLNEGADDEIGLTLVLGDSDDGDDATSYIGLQPNGGLGDIRLLPSTGKRVYVGTGDDEVVSGGWPRLVATRRGTETVLTTGGGNISVEWDISSEVDPGGDFTLGGGDVGSGDTYFETALLPAGMTFEVEAYWVIRNNDGSADAKESRLLANAPGATYETKLYQFSSYIEAGAGGVSDGIGVRGRWILSTGTADRTMQFYAAGFGSVTAHLIASEGYFAVRRIA